MFAALDLSILFTCLPYLHTFTHTPTHTCMHTNIQIMMLKMHTVNYPIQTKIWAIFTSSMTALPIPTAHMDARGIKLQGTQKIWQ